MPVTRLSDSDINRLLKRVYRPLANNVYATYDSILSQIAKETGPFGDGLKETIQLSQGGSVGASDAGILPTSNHAKTIQTSANARRHYARALIDNFAIEDARGGEASILKVVDFEIKNKILAFNRNRARNFFNDATGTLGQFSGNASGTATAPTVTILDTGRYRRRRLHFEPRDYVNVNSLTSVFEVVSYAETTGVLTLSRVSGSDDLTAIGAGTHSIFMQNSKDQDRFGLLSACFDTTYYGISAQYRFQPFVLPGTTDSDAQNAQLTTDMITSIYDKYSSDTEQAFTHIIMSPVQFRKYKSLQEARKRDCVEVQQKALSSGIGDEKLIAKVGYSAIKYFGADSSTVIMQHRLMRDDMVIFLNKEHIKERNTMNPGWLERDGSMWLRVDGLDQYEARYGAYGENLVNPYHVGFIQGLNTTEL